MSHPIEVEGLSVRFGGRLALEEVTFTLPRGCIAALVGPNGAGKTTLFRAMLGVIEPEHGSVRLPGGVAYVPQGDHGRLDLPLTALDVALMGRIDPARWWRPTGRADRAAAHAALEATGMADHATCQIGTLSGGQRQRVMIARALARDAAALLLDEPMTGVDAVSEASVTELMARLRAEGRTLLVATHDLNDAGRSADQILFLNRLLIAAGPPSEVFTTDVLRRTYGAEIVVTDPTDGRVLGVFDDASHHDHGHDHEVHDGHGHHQDPPVPHPHSHVER